MGIEAEVKGRINAVPGGVDDEGLVSDVVGGGRLGALDVGACRVDIQRLAAD